MPDTVTVTAPTVVSPPPALTGAPGEATKPGETTAKPDGTTTDTTAKPDTASKAWKAQLSREAKLVEQQRTLRAEQTALSEQRKAVDAYNAAIKEAKTNPLKVLEASGLTYEQLTQAVLNGGVPAPDLKVAALEDKLTEFQRSVAAEREAAATKEREALASEEQAAIQEFRDGVVSTVTAATDKYPILNAFGQSSNVIKLIEEHYAETEKVLSTEEAAAQVEASLVASLPAELDKYMAVPALRQLLQAALAKVTEAEKPPKPGIKAPAAPAKTITNSMTATTAAVTDPSKLTPKQRWNQTIARANELIAAKK